ncbi:SDR family oxidoreductase [candidate division KSB1 bacterium]|nr:SDR family oxidoreductase [candidate division KSB1 bacterium]RQW04374.1 MAG: SDR family oxidoreductase [candidate division KSB1 bacterium]
MDFRNKIVVLTGATGALGSVITTLFLSKGASVAAVARDVSKLTDAQRTASPGRLVTFAADVLLENEVAQLFDHIQDQLGGADILVHAVGGFSGGVSIQDTLSADWDRMMSLNLRSAFLCSKYALKQMQHKGGGKIVTISALAALEPKANRAAYLVAKAGLLALTRAIALEGKAINVQANSLAPAIILTQANKRDMPDMDHSAWVKPEDMAETILHLCSDKAQSITGTIIKMP